MFGQRVSFFGIRFLYTVGGRSRFRGIQNLCPPLHFKAETLTEQRNTPPRVPHETHTGRQGRAGSLRCSRQSFGAEQRDFVGCHPPNICFGVPSSTRRGP